VNASDQESRVRRREHDEELNDERNEELNVERSATRSATRNWSHGTPASGKLKPRSVGFIQSFIARIFRSGLF
jgi:hypothetical protein